ncbi:MAG: hypothetical protein GXY44_00790 [Phycisphaerales bacterium]|nr:hypothetical protein [Phycisphaerales bacterium]
MVIQSGTTGERRIRNLISLLMFGGFAAWFAWDGFYGYPAKNLQWARQAMPQPRPANLATNPRVLGTTLDKLNPGISMEELTELLGEPALIEDRQLHYVGRTMRVSVKFNEQGVVHTLVTEPIPLDKQPEKYNHLVFENQVAKVTPGLAEAEVKALLMEPDSVQPRTLWFVGPAAYVCVPVFEGRVADSLKPAVPSTKYTESDIRVQKVLAALLGIASLYIAWIFIRTLTTSALLDDSGLTLDGRHIPFSDMQELDISEYKSKGWVDLVYTADGRVLRQRIDSYHYARFQEIISAICNKKGFDSPFASDTPNMSDNEVSGGV